MKKLLLVFILLNFISGCVWYDEHFHHDNGLHRGQHKDHHDSHHGDDEGDDHGNHGKKGKKGKNND